MEENESGGGEHGRGVKDGCEEGVHQSTSTMAIINHQLCYFLSGDYLGEERLQDGTGKAKVCMGSGLVVGCQVQVALQGLEFETHCSSHPQVCFINRISGWG